MRMLFIVSLALLVGCGQFDPRDAEWGTDPKAIRAATVSTDLDGTYKGTITENLAVGEVGIASLPIGKYYGLALDDGDFGVHVGATYRVNEWLGLFGGFSAPDTNEIGDFGVEVGTQFFLQGFVVEGRYDQESDETFFGLGMDW